MSKVAVCAALGAVVALVGAVVGVLLILDTTFVVATLQCNTTAPGSAGNDTNCVDNTLVSPSSGEVCQVGNLGLFTAAYTPECTVNQIGYDLTSSPPPLNAGFETNTKDFGILFPAQTNFAGLLEAVPNFDLEFESCESYFQSTELAQGVAAVGVGAGTNGFNDFAGTLLPIVQTQGVPGFAGFINDTVSTLCDAAWNKSIDGLTATGHPPPLDTSAAYTSPLSPSPFPTYFDALDALIGVLPSENAARITGIKNILLGGQVATGSNNPTVQFLGACSGLYTGNDGLPRDGFFSPMNSQVLCGSILQGASCSYADFFLGQDPVESPEVIPLQTLINEYIAGFNADAQSLPVRAIFGGDLTVDDLEVIVANKSFNVLFGLVFGLALERDVFFDNVAAGLTTDDILPDDFDAPLSNVAVTLCTGLQLPTPCSFLQVTNQAYLGLLLQLSVLPQSQTIARFQLKSQADGLNLLVNIMQSCKNQSVTDLDTCLLLATQIPVTDDLTLTDVAAATIFGKFYDVEPGLSYAEYAAAAISQCSDDEKDIAAIVQAQTLVPAGVALGFVGGVSALLASGLVFLGKGGKAGKLTALVAGIFSLVGVVLIIVALLGIIQAPIYQGVGASSGPIDDNSQLRSQGPGANLAYITLGAGLAGSVIVLIGAGAMFLMNDDDAEKNALSGKM